MVSPNPKEITLSWLTKYATALYSNSPTDVVQLFLPDGWLRDVLTFTWDMRSSEGRTKIESYLLEKNALQKAGISSMQLDERQFLQPQIFQLPRGQQGVEGSFTFETKVGHGHGRMRLLRDVDGEWKAFSVSMFIFDLRGYEEASFESGIYGGHTIPWEEVFAERKRKVETDPHVLIIGGGQCGLNVAARFKQMGIPSLLIERNARIGDNWRKRYPTLTLHTTKYHHQMLYQTHPSNWPLFTPRDKLADTLESYAINQDLVVWTSSQIQGRPTYDTNTRKWTVTIDHNGEQAHIQPHHIVLATGILGGPHMPHFLDEESFSGTILHQTEYMGGGPYKGKHVVVIGAGNTSIDICQDLCHYEAASVTVVQRSSSCVVDGENATKHINLMWPEGVPTEICDFKFASTSFGQLKKINQGIQDLMWEEEKVLHAKLRKGGIQLNMGPEGAGQFLMVWERCGGYWLDKGGADLIASGEIKVKQGLQPTAFSKDGLIFEDGSTLKADVVLFATGYQNIREVNRELFGPEVIDQTSVVWGLDKEGELNGSYRPSGHPGLWFASGDFYTSRFMSKHLGIQIKAIELGLINPFPKDVNGYQNSEEK